MDTAVRKTTFMKPSVRQNRQEIPKRSHGERGKIFAPKTEACYNEV